MKISTTRNKNTYITQFWVGLMDGDGSIQVNHWRMKGLQYRLVIKLKMTPNNLSLFQELSRVIGGSARLEADGRFVLWVENHKEEIKRIVKLFETYPPLTTRLSLQLEFLHRCLLKNDVAWYLENRRDKYRDAPARRELLRSSSISLRSYYKPWLSGFVEAEGCFTLRANSSRNHSFSISQKGDDYLLESIRVFFRIPNEVRGVARREMPPQFFILETYRRDVWKRMIEHFTQHPLLGEKRESFLLFLKRSI